MVFKLINLVNVSQVIMIMGNETLTDNSKRNKYEGATFDDDDPKFAALLAESEESGSEYKGPASDDLLSEPESEDEPGCEEGPELEDEEPDTKIRLKTSKKQKKGLVARDQISAAVAAITDKPNPRLDSNRGEPEKAAAPKT
jgi:hypothetical protein